MKTKNCLFNSNKVFQCQITKTKSLHLVTVISCRVVFMSIARLQPMKKLIWLTRVFQAQLKLLSNRLQFIHHSTFPIVRRCRVISWDERKSFPVVGMQQQQPMRDSRNSRSLLCRLRKSVHGEKYWQHISKVWTTSCESLDDYVVFLVRLLLKRLKRRFLFAGWKKKCWDVEIKLMFCLLDWFSSMLFKFT